MIFISTQKVKNIIACTEIGHPPHRQYQCQFQVEIDPSTTFHACVVADNKKTAQRKASLDMVIKLYRANLIEGNRGDRFSTYPAKVSFNCNFPMLFKSLFSAGAECHAAVVVAVLIEVEQ